MHPSEMSPAEIVEVLHHAYEADIGLTIDAPAAQDRAVLADFLGCHPEIKETVWTLWRQALQGKGIAPDDAEYWLDREFTEPCRRNNTQD